ncbi:methyltransferase [Candidatus Woesearchaeota archaeon]|nr:methyltransferase [Candidatus Woesearchaeota archaeon]
MSKKELAVMLSKLKVFEEPEMKLEQYPTDSEVAADALWLAYMQGDVDGKVIADLGSGTGILGLGALALGAKKAYLVDIDAKAMELAMENKEFLEEKLGRKLEAAFSAGDISMFDEKVDVVIMNPPFGTKNEHIDSAFLLKAMDLAKTIYTFHKASTKNFIDRLISESKFKAIHYQECDFPLKQSMPQHRKRIERIRVGLWRLEKKQ